MHLAQLPPEFQKALPILSTIRAAGFEAYFVGGSVRDTLLGMPIHDVDIATSAYPQEIKSLFKQTVDLGLEHGTVLVLYEGEGYEITTFRTEEAYVDYRRPSKVHFVRSLDEDLKRRDFTVNAFALSQQAEVVDLFGGLQDLEAKRLRAVGEATERFSEDALRVMRGFRFVAGLGFELEEDTFEAMVACSPLLEKIAVERIFVEFDKLLLAPYWRQGLEVLQASQAYRYLPLLDDHDTGLGLLLETYPRDHQFKDQAQAWAALLLACRISAKQFAKSYKLSNKLGQTIANVMTVYRLDDLDLMTLYSYGLEVVDWAWQLKAASGIEVDLKLPQNLDARLTIHDKSELAITGKDLMKDLSLPAGPQVGKFLKEIELAVVLGKLANERDSLLTFAKQL